MNAVVRSAPWVCRPVVYRCYAADGELLYIGSSINVEQRMRAHLETSFWRPWVDRVRIQIVTDEVAARRMEAEAIGQENPRFNLQHRRPRSEWTQQDFHDVIRALRSRPTTTVVARRIAGLRRELACRLEGVA